MYVFKTSSPRSRANRRLVEDEKRDRKAGFQSNLRLEDDRSAEACPNSRVFVQIFLVPSYKTNWPQGKKKTGDLLKHHDRVSYRFHANSAKNK